MIVGLGIFIRKIKKVELIEKTIYSNM